ncbi:MAG: succinate dehydrogenase cytochrome b subunit [Muribaculaceae bacterium]|nr:succinate dehydrogenase cytochrome b subunit [Muribaculaceae bacterium]
MAITGACLVLFVTFHVLMNSVALLWPAAYNDICQFLGANWYALVASAGLALLFVLHIILALVLTVKNRKARGADRYAVTSCPPQVEWSSKNMLVLGIVVVAFLGVHLIQFWAKMQLQELISHDPTSWATVDGAAASPAMGTLFIQAAFSCWWTPVIYIIGFVALWFHMNHGFWSMFQTIGWNGRHWIERLKKIGMWWTTIVIALFIAQAVVFTIQANKHYYTTDTELQEQYATVWGDKAQTLIDDFQKEMSAAQKATMAPGADAEAIQKDFFLTAGAKFVNEATIIDSCATKQCPDAFNPELNNMRQMREGIKQQIQYISAHNNGQR